MVDSGLRLQYATSSDGAKIAVGRSGSGSPLVVVPALFGSVTDAIAGGWEQLSIAHGYEFISYDRRGVRLSAGGVFPPDGQLLVDDLRAVTETIDASSYSMASVFIGSLEAIAVAATDERLDRLVLVDPAVSGVEWAQLPTVRALRAGLAEDWEFFTEAFMANALGWRELRPELVAQLRDATTPEEAMSIWDAVGSLDVSGLLSEIRARTLVTHRPGWFWPPSHSQRIASDIPDCQLSIQTELESASFERVVGAFLDESRGADPGPPQGLGSGLRTILFTDLESSTALTQRLGDAAAQELLARHNSVVRDAVAQHEGVEIKHTGDGIMASFDSAVGAVRASLAVQDGLSTTDIRVRIGLNAGEPIAEDGDLFGTAVQLAARICEHANPGEVLMSRVVADLCAGKGFTLVQHGEATFKGFSEQVTLYQVITP